MKIIFGFIISTMLLLSGVKAQEQSAVDSIKREVKERIDPKEFIPTGIRIGTEMISGVASFTNNPIQEFQFLADVDFYRYFFNVQYGTFSGEWENANGIYTNDGSHFKIGPDVNFLHRDPDGSALFFGVRYSFSNFSDNYSYTDSDPIWGTYSNEVSNNNLSASWIEFVSGLKVKVLGPIWMGYTARFKFGVTKFEDKDLIPHWIPGFGRGDENSYWGFDYWLIVRLPVRKQKKISLPIE